MFKETPEQEPYKGSCCGVDISLNHLINRIRRYKNYWHHVTAINGNVKMSFSVAYDGKRLYGAVFRRDVTIREFKKCFLGIRLKYEGYSN